MNFIEIDLSTKIWLLAIQVWPVFKNLNVAILFAAESMSAVLSTIV